MSELVAWIAVGVSVVAVVIAVLQSRIAKRALEMPVLVDMLHEFRSPDFKRRQDRLYRELPGRNPSDGFDGLPADLRADVLYVSHFYDHIGLLMRSSAVEKDDIARFLGGSAASAWKHSKPFIRRQREITGEPYQQYFEGFVRALPQATARQVRGS